MRVRDYVLISIIAVCFIIAVIKIVKSIIKGGCSCSPHCTSGIKNTHGCRSCGHACTFCRSNGKQKNNDKKK